MDNIIEPKTLPGFMELLPKEQVLFNQMMQTIQKSYERFGFLPLDTPIIESSQVLLARAGGETEKQVYRFNKGDTDMLLRFDLTVPLAKYVAEYYNDLTFPFKRYQIGKAYRGEKPQKGRYREFYQCDVDIIGDGELNIVNDAVIPSVIYTTFSELGFDDFTIYINNRKILNGVFKSLKLTDNAADIMRIIDKIDKIGKEGVKKELANLKVAENAINTIINFISIQGSIDEKLKTIAELKINNETYKEGIDELTEVVRGIRLLGVPDKYFTIELKIARGLDYYTGTVYETFLNKYKNLGSICSGGRYDNLAEFYTAKKLPGVGISIGLTRLFYQLNEAGLIKNNKKSIAEVLVVPMDKEIEDCLAIAGNLRNAKINTELYLEDAKIKSKMKYADKLEIPYVIIVGEEERKSKLYVLKDMKTGEQEKLTIQEIINTIKGD